MTDPRSDDHRDDVGPLVPPSRDVVRETLMRCSDEDLRVFLSRPHPHDRASVDRVRAELAIRNCEWLAFMSRPDVREWPSWEVCSALLPPEPTP